MHILKVYILVRVSCTKFVIDLLELIKLLTYMYGSQYGVFGNALAPWVRSIND